MAPRQPQLMSPSRYDPELTATLFRHRAQGIARQLLGPRAELVFEHAMLKPVGAFTPTPWHQDQAFYRALTRTRSITLWMPLQDTPDEAGALKFVPGSHRGPLLAHRSIADDPRRHGLEAIGVEGLPRVTCPLPAGGASIHHSRTLHGAGPNALDRPRLAYALGFGIRSTLPIVWREYPWNAEKRTARLERARASAIGSKALRHLVRKIFAVSSHRVRR
jgi:hypothetical protein